MMGPAVDYDSVRASQADAVFVSALQRSGEPDAGQVRWAIAAAFAAFGHAGCAGRVAQEFGDHPETAVARMRWARMVAREACEDPAREPGPGPDAWPLLVVPPPAEQASSSPGSQAPPDAARQQGSFERGGDMPAMISDSWPQRSWQAIKPAERHGWGKDPAVAIACAAMGGAMIAQGRLREAGCWPGHAERTLQPEVELR